MLSKRYIGPYKILRSIGTIAYELKSPPESWIHLVLHVSKLKFYYGDPLSQSSPLDPTIMGTPVSSFMPFMNYRCLYHPHFSGRQMPNLGLVGRLAGNWRIMGRYESLWYAYPKPNLQDKVVIGEMDNYTTLAMRKD